MRTTLSKPSGSVVPAAVGASTPAVTGRAPRVLVAIGLVALLLAGVWRIAAPPLLERFPSDIDETYRYTGTFTTFLDAETGAALAEPKVEPLVVERRVHSVSSSFSEAVLREEVAMTIGSAAPVVERHQYVLDRRSMEFVADGRNWTFSPDNVIDRAGAVRITFPMKSSASGTYAVWNNETATAVDVTDGRRRTVDGTAVLDFASGLDRPVSAEYREVLLSRGLPATIGLEGVKPILAAAGIDLDAAGAALLGILTPEDAATLTAALGTPIPLEYSFFADATASVHPRTGRLVDHVATEGVKVAPAASAIGSLRTLLAKYAGDADVDGVIRGLDRVAAMPAQHAFDAEFEETPASVDLAIGRARDDAAQMRLVDRIVPFGLVAMAIALLAAGLGLRNHRKTHAAPAGRPVARHA